MDKKYLIIGFVVTFLALTAWKYNAGQKDDWKNSPNIGVVNESSELCTTPPCYFQKGEILVMFKTGVIKGYAEALVEALGYEIFHDANISNVQAFGVRVPIDKENEAIAKFEAETVVKYAYPNFLAEVETRK